MAALPLPICHNDGPLIAGIQADSALALSLDTAGQAAQGRAEDQGCVKSNSLQIRLFYREIALVVIILANNCNKTNTILYLLYLPLTALGGTQERIG